LDCAFVNPIWKALALILSSMDLSVRAVDDKLLPQMVEDILNL